MPCSYCDKNQVLAKGLCRACYYRLRNTGSIEYKFKGKPKKQCQAEGCTLPIVANGMCRKHYENIKKYGETMSLFGYGERRKHPLYETWRSQKRCAHGRVAEWDDFWVFACFAPEKDGDRSTPKRYDVKAPWGPDNFYWHEKISCSRDKKEYARRWRSQNKLKAKGYSLKKSFGIGLNQYMDMYADQQGRCAICGAFAESFSEGDGGKSKTLVVDHCHKTGKVRKLLCHACNKALGGFKDSSQLLKKAVKYLAAHSTE